MFFLSLKKDKNSVICVCLQNKLDVFQFLVIWRIKAYLYVCYLNNARFTYEF